MNEIEKMREAINDDDLSLNTKTVFAFMSCYVMMSGQKEIIFDVDFISSIFGLTEDDFIFICEVLKSKGYFDSLEVGNEI